MSFSVSYKNSNLHSLESLHIGNEEAFMQALRLEGLIKECVLLQTCNRIELYCAIQSCDKEKAVKQVLKVWSTTVGMSYDLVRKFAQIYEEREVLTHLFFVASGLESMVLGEDQILGQLRSAFLKAKECGASGITLDTVFAKAIRVGRRIRTETSINRGSVSVSSAAVELAKMQLGDLSTKKVLVIGAGEAGSLAAEAVNGHSVSNLMITNRTIEKSRVLAEKVNGSVIPFSDVYSTICLSDLVIVAVAVEKPIITQADLAPFVANGVRNTLIIDVSQPRAVEEDVSSLQGFSLKKIDDLNSLIARNLSNRQVEAERSKTLISEELKRFEAALTRNLAEPLIDDICRKMEEIRQRELKRAISKMGGVNEKNLAVMDRFSRELVERITQIPFSQLREAAFAKNDALLTAAEQLFNSKTESV